MQLMQILSDSDISNVITWLPHGKSFMILERDKLEKVNLPGVCKYSSFIQKLKNWSFQKVEKSFFCTVLAFRLSTFTLLASQFVEFDQF